MCLLIFNYHSTLHSWNKSTWLCIIPKLVLRLDCNFTFSIIFAICRTCLNNIFISFLKWIWIFPFLFCSRIKRLETFLPLKFLTFKVWVYFSVFNWSNLFTSSVYSVGIRLFRLYIFQARFILRNCILLENFSCYLDFQIRIEVYRTLCIFPRFEGNIAVSISVFMCSLYVCVCLCVFD